MGRGAKLAEVTGTTQGKQRIPAESLTDKKNCRESGEKLLRRLGPPNSVTRSPATRVGGSSKRSECALTVNAAGL